MRILFINDRTSMGGKEKYLIATREALKQAGNVTALIYSVQPDPKVINDDDISFFIPGIDNYRNIRATLARLRECTSLFEPDIIHLNHNAANLIAVAWLLRHFPSLRSVHDVEFVCPTRRYVRKDTHRQCDSGCGAICFSAGCLSISSPRAFYRLIRTKLAQRMYARWSRLNTQSPYLQNILLKFGGHPGSVSMLPAFLATATPCGLPSRSNPMFLYVGRLNYWKGPQLVIEAMAQLPVDARLEIVGMGSMEQELRSLVQMGTLQSRVRFAGFLGEERLQQKYKEAFAVVVPSLMPENCPLSVQEAMAAGRAVVSTTVGGIPDLVENGVTGYLVPPNDVPALAAAMRRLLDNPQLCQTFGLNGCGRIGGEQYRREYHVRRLTEEYELAIGAFRWRGGDRKIGSV